MQYSAKAGGGLDNPFDTNCYKKWTIAILDQIKNQFYRIRGLDSSYKVVELIQKGSYR